LNIKPAQQKVQLDAWSEIYLLQQWHLFLGHNNLLIYCLSSQACTMLHSYPSPTLTGFLNFKLVNCNTVTASELPNENELHHAMKPSLIFCWVSQLEQLEGQMTLLLSRFCRLQAICCLKVMYTLITWKTVTVQCHCTLVTKSGEMILKI
jgi:hypothetical protein